MRSARVAALAALLAFAPGLFAVTFSQNHYYTGSQPQSIVSADINRDGRPDLIVADSYSNYISVLLGNDANLFTMGTNIKTADQPIKLVAGDFNNDGYPDVAVLENTGFQIFLSTQNGTLTPLSMQAIPSYGHDIVAIDLNGDHVPDLAIIRCTASCSLETWLNNKSATFTEKQGIALGGYTSMNNMAAADFDLDGHDDLAVGSDNKVLIFHSNDNGYVSLRQTITMPDGFNAGQLAAGDIDAMKGADLVVAGWPSCVPTDCIQSPWAHVYLNDGSGNLIFNAKYDTTADNLVQLLLVDVTGDNRLDIVGLNSALQMNNGSLVWAHYVGNGTYSSFSTAEQLGYPTQMIARDFNLDSRHDIALTDRGFGDYGVDTGTYVFYNQSYGAYCHAPGSDVLSVTLCSMTNSGDTYTFEAVGNSPTGVRRLELWIDGNKYYNSPDDRLRYKTTLSSGSHKIEIVAVDQFDGTTKITNYVTAP